MRPPPPPPLGRLGLEELRQRPATRRQTPKRRAGGDERVPDRVVAVAVDVLDHDRAALELRSQPALPQGDDELVPAGGHLDVERLGISGERRDLALLGDAPRLEDEDPVAHALDVTHDVRREHDADSEVAVRLADEVEHLVASRRVEAGHRLVEQDEDRVVHERLGELHPLLHPGRVAADRPVPLLEQPDVPERVGGARPGVAGREPADSGHVGQELGRGNVVGEAVVLGHVAETRPNRDVARRVLAENLGSPLGRLDQAEEQLDRRALACTVRAEQPGDRLLDLEVDVVECDHVLVALGQLTRSEQDRHSDDRSRAVYARPVARHIALLRGINLGATNRIAMPELRALLADAGFEDVQTYLQSGNVVLTSRAGPQKVARECERLIADRLGLEIPVVVRTRDELAEVVARNPLGRVATNPKRYQVSFLDGELDPQVVEKLDAAALPSERVVVLGREIYAWHPKGVARSKLWAQLAGRGLGVIATARNWTTVTSLLALADA